MVEVVIKISDEQYKALATQYYDVKEWAENFLKTRANRIIDNLVERSGEGSRFTPRDKKLKIFKSLKVETAKEREDKLRAEMEGKDVHLGQ